MNNGSISSGTIVTSNKFCWEYTLNVKKGLDKHKTKL